MATRIGINGLGRIGRQVLKVMVGQYSNEFDIVAFNDLGDLATMAHLFRYDSNYGKYEGTVEVTVRWPDGRVENLSEIATSTRWRIVRQDAGASRVLEIPS